MRSVCCFYQSIGEKIIPDWSEYLGGVGVGDASGGGGSGDVADAFGDVVSEIFGLKKKNGSGTSDLCMLLPSNL